MGMSGPRRPGDARRGEGLPAKLVPGRGVVVLHAVDAIVAVLLGEGRIAIGDGVDARRRAGGPSKGAEGLSRLRRRFQVEAPFAPACFRG
jgi:hypothetical protein